MTHILSFSEKFRPQRWDDFVGQERWLQESGIIKRSIARGRPTSILLWGPPGSGKTSLAGLYLKSFSCPSLDFHPTRFHMADVKKALDDASSSPLFRPTIVWIDEIHRLTRPQQDMLLRGVEDGSIALVAATTENPSFVLSNALLSRLTVLTFLPLQEEDLSKVCEKVLSNHPEVVLGDDARQLLMNWASGDARKLLSSLEVLVEMKHEGTIDAEKLLQTLSHHVGSCIAEGEGRYILISALHKAVRGSDCQAALYWFSRLLHAGEDPLYIARRLLRMATEDIGLADPQSLSVALHGQECFKALGRPEGELALAEVVIYLALCPKSAAAYVAFGKVKEVAKETSHLAPPPHIVNAPTTWMKKQGFGEGYCWDHEMPDAFSGQNYFPEGVREKEFYEPVSRGFERELEKRIAYFRKLKAQREEEGKSDNLPPE